MEKIFKTLVIILALLCTAPSWASCTQEKIGTFRGGLFKEEVVTGGACSIKDLNLENNKVTKETVMPRNLRPVRSNPRIPSSFNDDCLFGMCLYRRILENEKN